MAGLTPTNVSPLALAALAASSCGRACSPSVFTTEQTVEHSSYIVIRKALMITSIINGTNLTMLSVANLRWDWNSRTTMIGHSVSTLKL